MAQQWKHGWIPLTAAAVRAKNHGKTPGKGSKLGKKMAALKKGGAASSGTPGNSRRGGSGGATGGRFRNANERAQLRAQDADYDRMLDASTAERTARRKSYEAFTAHLSAARGTGRDGKADSKTLARLKAKANQAKSEHEQTERDLADARRRWRAKEAGRQGDFTGALDTSFARNAAPRNLRPGDTFQYMGIADVTVLAKPQPHDSLQGVYRIWARREDTGKEGWLNLPRQSEQQVTGRKKSEAPASTKRHRKEALKQAR